MAQTKEQRMKKPTKKTIDTWIFSLGIAGILITAVTQNTTIMIITAACYGYIGGRLYGRDEK